MIGRPSLGHKAPWGKIGNDIKDEKKTDKNGRRKRSNKKEIRKTRRKGGLRKTSGEQCNSKNCGPGTTRPLNNKYY